MVAATGVVADLLEQSETGLPGLVGKRRGPIIWICMQSWALEGRGN